MSSPISKSAIDELHTLIPDLKIITPDSPEYEANIDRWFFLSIKRAGAVVFPTSVADTSSILRFTQKHSIPIAAKGGGHGLRGESSTEEGNKIIARGGALWSEVYAEAEKFDLAPVGGICPDVGVGGFVLHGGYGFLSSAHGLGVDNMLEVEVVLADGSVVCASDSENQDLFWAMKGAGGCFGIVTEFVLKGHEQKNEVWTGKMIFPKTTLKVVVEMGNRILERENKGNAVMGHFWGYSTESEEVMLAIIPFYNGPQNEAEEFFAPLLELNPIVNKAKMVPFSQSGDSATVAGKWRKLSVARSMITPMNADFLEERLNEFEEFLQKVPDAREQSIVGFEIMGTRALTSVKQNETAFADRGNHTTVRIIPIYLNEDNYEVCKKWCFEMERKFQMEFEQRQKDPLLDETTRSSTGVYLNYDGFGLSAKTIFGVNYERLVELKKKYDPQNVFKNCVDLL
ncbi:FAD-binding domain-containing protein [Mollisia scopiformis]|uniref:FAD-binding domain-containing protein n=1 Tax=Mollisia scopiformis TaxID=149040 RepID=A0A132B8L4_MOLSC|nr:FAD-binding domain-containing protein [Mollisia scopiformis]KUJ08736.1 FAD-binding domain-containing protein [Mollisia scopiformis]